MELNLKNPMVFFDLETTGINVASDRIVEISWLKASGYSMGQYLTQVAQPVHFSSIIYRGFFLRMTLKSPAEPSTLSTSVYVRTSMFGCRPTSTSLGERIHMEQSLVGNVLSSWAICPPMLGSFSTR